MKLSFPANLACLGLSLLAFSALASCNKKAEKDPEIYIVPADVIYDAPGSSTSQVELPADLVED